MATINNKLQLALVMTALLGLAACSSKPSPWSQKSSPWDNQSAQEAQQEDTASQVVEPEMGTEQSPMMADEMAAGEGMAMAETEMAPAMEEAPAMAEPVEIQPEPEMVAPVEMAMAGDILSQPATHFTVQVCASSSMENLQGFARANNLSDQWTAQTSVNGKIWYILLTGVYATKAEANAALGSVQGIPTSPWVRTVGSVQAVAVH